MPPAMLVMHRSLHSKVEVTCIEVFAEERAFDTARARIYCQAPPSALCEFYFITCIVGCGRGTEWSFSEELFLGRAGN